jgi:uncharacterized membrane protein
MEEYMSDNSNFIISIPKKGLWNICYLVPVGVLGTVAIRYIANTPKPLPQNMSVGNVIALSMSLIMVYVLIASSICLVVNIWKRPLKELGTNGKINGLKDGLTSWGLNSLIGGMFFGVIMGLFLGPAIFVIPIAFSLIVGLLIGTVTGMSAEFRNTATNKGR